MPKRYKCIACNRPVELNKYMRGIEAGPACVPCFWAAKLKYEQSITTIDAIAEPFRTALFQFFQRTGDRWPDDLIDRWQSVDFEKVSKKNQGWWFATQRKGAASEA